MTPEQAAKVLAVAAAFDARLTPPTREDAAARALVWAQALQEDMTPEWAQQAVVSHYAESTAAVMPANLNSAWRVQRRADAERRHREALLAIPADGVPMPDEVRAEWRRLVQRTASS